MLRRDLTYIPGGRCTDGIVLIGDRRVTRGSDGYEYEHKIFADVRNVVIGASGIVGLFDKFRREIA
jgi:20S proteasome alpha/beta subunit